MSKSITNSIFSCLLLCLLLSSCGTEPETVVHIDKEDFGVEDQYKIGQNLSALIATSTNFYQILETNESPEFYEYINTVFGSIVNTSLVETRNEFDWEVIILRDDNMHSAFTIPGGKLYIYTGLLKAIESENELFAILAHELYYSEKDVLMDRMKIEYGTLVMGDLVLGTNSTGAIDVAETVYNMKLSSESVALADQFSVKLVCPFQYDARGLISFIQRVTTTFDEIEWLVNRPGSSDRLDAIHAIAQDCGEQELSFSERYEYQKSLLP